MGLNKEQLEFLEKELELKKEKIEIISEKEWEEVREKCFEIEADELLDMNDEGKDIDRDEKTKRCQLAISIVDTEFSEVGSKGVA